MCNTTHPRKAHYFAYQLNSKAKSTLATYRCLAPWLHVPLALEYMERVVTTMSEMSAVMTRRECSRGLEIPLMLVCKKL
jgi:hypothetical protein